MKILLVGGAYQGKRAYAEKTYALLPDDIADGGGAPLDTALAVGALDRLHLLTRRLLDAGADPVDTVLGALDAREDWLAICDEIGAGIVPVDADERRWRERTGRLCCALAERADRVERISLGIPITLKG